MIEIIAYVYTASFCISLTLSLLYRNKMAAEFRSGKYRRLNQNLGRIGLFWSTEINEFRKIAGEDSIAQDQEAAFRSFRRFATIACLTSAAGLILLILFILSMRYFARPRIEKRVFSSPLAIEENLDTAHVATVVDALSREFGLEIR